jgi:hypothetical protein
MAVLAVNEVLPRGYSHQFGGSPTASLVLVVTVDAPTPQQDVLAVIGYSLGTAHPEFSFLKCSGIELTETDKFHVEASLSFSIAPPSGEDPGQPPWASPDVWSFSTGSGQSACTTHYPDDKVNNITAPLTNKANDAYEGITKAEPELKATITGYRQLFPATDATLLTGAINDAAFCGGGPRTWQCAGISGTPEQAVIAEQLSEYWQITIELIYRRSTHNLLLPNAGLNYLENGVAGKKRRCWVIDESGDKVPSAGPLALANNGDLKQIGAGPYPPDILTFRIYPEENFSQWFGSPPATVQFGGAPP